MISRPDSLQAIRASKSPNAACRLPPLEWQQVACTLCGADDFETLLSWRDAKLVADAALSVVRCRRCGLALTNPRPTPGSMGRFYPEDYCCYEMRRPTRRRWRAWWRERLHRAVLQSFLGYGAQSPGLSTKLLGWLGLAALRGGNRRAEWIPFRGAGRLLDFGCGAGEFLERMRGRGWSVEGLDMSTLVAHAVIRERGIRVHAGTLPHPNLLPGTFDCVTMWQSLEHVHEPRRIVGEARRLLRPEGLLLVAAPNFGGWSARTFGRHWYGLDAPRHLTHFTPHTLSKLLELEGFRILKLTHVGVDGWLRQSARRARAERDGGGWLRFCEWKPLARRLAAWTERTQQADDMVVLAQRD